MDTGTILAILIVVLSLASSLVTRLLKNAAGRSLENGPAAVTDEDSPEPLQPAEAQRQSGSETSSAPAWKPEVAAYNIPDDLLDGGYKSVKDIVKERKSRVPAARQDSPGNRLVIDKKKLVIYSEIMKTKF